MKQKSTIRSQNHKDEYMNHEGFYSVNVKTIKKSNVFSPVPNGVYDA